MDSRPIGVFDSGLGGLTAVRELRNLLPHEQIVYFGDTARVPYGGRSPQTILRYAVSDMHFLLSKQVKEVVIACGTVSAVAAGPLRSQFDLPIHGVVDTASAEAVRATRSGRIGVIGTAASIRSDAYAHTIQTLLPRSKVTSVPCPLLVPLVENGRWDNGDIVVSTVLEEYLTPIREADVDTLILGCTHYPLLREAIAAHLPQGVTLIDPGVAVARELARGFEREPARRSDGPGGLTVYVSDTENSFDRLAKQFLGSDTEIHARRVDIEGF